MSTSTAHREVILAGSGGQGLVLSAILLAQAAMSEGRNVVQTQSYGIATRGGLSLAEVIMDDGEIIFQQVRRPDCVLVLTEEAARKYDALAARGVPFYYDSTLVRERQGPNMHGFPFTRLASELGNAGSVNVLAIGTLAARSGLVGRASLEQAVRRQFKGAAAELNLMALATGSQL